MSEAVSANKDTDLRTLIIVAVISGLMGGAGGVGGTLSTIDEDRIVAKAVQQMDAKRQGDLRWLQAEFDSLKASNARLTSEFRDLRVDLKGAK